MASQLTTPSTSRKFINTNPIHLAREEYFGLPNKDDEPANGRGIVFSYAPPDVLRQAKLEAMEIKIRRKMLEHKAAQGDPHALRELEGPGEIDIAALAELTGSGPKVKGGRDQVKALVVPPELTEHGDEVRGSSKIILGGQRRDFEHAAHAAGGAGRGARGGAAAAGAAGGGGGGGSGTMPSYRTSDLTERLDAAAARRKKPAPGSARAGGPPRKAPKPKPDPRLAELREGMLTYVPAKEERPEGVGRGAFVTQAQAMLAARTEYEAVKPRRPASAPMRRYFSGSLGPGSNAGNGRIPGWDAPERAGSGFGDRGSGGGGGGGGGGAGMGGLGMGGRGVPAGMSDKWSDVPMVRVEETDLLATYKAQSLKLAAAALAEAAAPPARDRGARPASARALAGAGAGAISKSLDAGSSSGPVRYTVRSDAVTKHDMSPPRGSGAGGGGGRPGSAGRGGGGGASHLTRSADASGAAMALAAAVAEADVVAAAARARVAAGGSSRSIDSAAALRRRQHTVLVLEPHEEEGAEAERQRRLSATGNDLNGGAGGSPPYARRSAPAGPASAAAAAAAAAAGSPYAASSRPSSAAPGAPLSPGLPPRGASATRHSVDVSSSPYAASAAAAAAAAAARSRPSSAAVASKLASSFAAAAAQSPWGAPAAAGGGGSRPSSATPFGAAGQQPVARSSSPGNPSGLRRPASATSANGRTSPTGANLADPYGAPRVAYAPVDPETRRAQQTRPGSAIGTLKTNGRIRGHSAARRPSSATPQSGASWSSPHSPYSASYGTAGAAVPSDTWATASTSFPGSDVKSILQERILDGIARQYEMSPEEAEMAAAAAAAKGDRALVVAGPGGTARAAPKKTGMTAEEAAAAAHTMQQTLNISHHRAGGQAGSGGRPVSAPNRRLRPPSAGHWAGRPEPEAFAAANRSITGMVYDPEVQPGPLDTYMSSLVGLD
ncbi:hypothetical protein HYH03_002895 [Edaphochlamys debaryana]|uniref:Uncharacterized protein n=1 Tax=Edaphochlamys debaryana TaxID=47281 RepID=A0A836C525_9CHLO|nr:hypothetical protein HYH03_002895 [Edaphochlamys debaryana]|eukprot:KAG2499317.1 hypothetical protein HYH03_002895 [Edaphochlamys debaryana]